MRGAGLAIWLGEEAARTPLGSSDVAELKGEEEEGSRRARGGARAGMAVGGRARPRLTRNPVVRMN